MCDTQGCPPASTCKCAHVDAHLCECAHHTHRISFAFYNKSWAVLNSDWLNWLPMIPFSVSKQSLKAIGATILCVLGLF